MGQSEPVIRLLRACARITLDEAGRERLVAAAVQIPDWSPLVVAAENHGVAPLVWRHVRDCEISVPEPFRSQLVALVVRHRHAHQVQSKVLVEIADALDAAAIEHLVLKGAALAHVSYPEPELRPMADLDILVDPRDAVRAQTRLAEIGFHAPLPTATRRPWHHHLPIATCHRDGYRISVELHTDAMSGDQPVTLGLRSVTQPPREFVVGGRRLRAFAHEDMLNHVSAHALQPRSRTRLVHVADLVGYAEHYATEIDWERMRRSHPRVVNALALMHYVTPLPPPLDMLAPAPHIHPPAGVGRGLAPLSTVWLRRRGFRDMLRELLYPSEWWLRAYYGVAPGQSLAPTRWARHAPRVAYWGLRRARATQGARR